MTNQQYVDAVARGEFPQFARVPLGEGFKDQRGEILNLILSEGLVGSVAEIGSARGSVRANHYHKTDWHFTYVAAGSVLYFERPIGSAEVPEPEEFVPGEVFFTPPNVEHAMLFSEDSVILTFAKNVRTHENHEADLVRVSFVTPEIVAKYVP